MLVISAISLMVGSSLIEGMGEKAEDVLREVASGLQDRQMPNVNTVLRPAKADSMSKQRRLHIINTTSPGATTTIFIGKHGNDLYVAWRTFIRPVINQQILMLMLLIDGFLGLVLGGFTGRSSGFTSNVRFSFIGWVEVTVILMILSVLLMMLAGKLIRDDVLVFFFVKPNLFDADDIAAMSLSAHKTILRALDLIGIDSSKLRIKQNFKGGRQGEDV